MSGASLGRIELEIDGDGPPIVFLHGLGGDIEFVPAAPVGVARFSLHPARFPGRRAIRRARTFR